jgi:ribokinase
MNEPKIGVIGLGGQSAFMAAAHFPAPGETISCNGLFFEPGGKGYNQAIACARMGVQTVFIGAVGADDNAEICRKDLLRQGVTPCLIEKNIPTAYAVIMTDSSGENTVSVFPGAAKAITPEDLRSKEVFGQLKECTCLLLQNELSADCLLEACKIGQELKIPVIFNPAPAEDVPAEAIKNSTLITPNYGEAKYLTGYAEDDRPTGEAIAERLMKQGVYNAVITLGGQGALVMERGNIQRIPAFSCGRAVDTTGAGDTFNGFLTAALSQGRSLHEAARLAAVAAGISVTRHGAAGSIPTKAEVEEYEKL